MEETNNIFQLCSGYFDTEKNKFVVYADEDIFKCCIKQCKKPYQLCKNYCLSQYTGENLKKCNKECNNFKTNCRYVCDVNNISLPFTKCLEKICPENTDKCISDNKKTLLSCCRNNCCNDLDTNCDKLCEYLHNYTFKEKRDEEINSIENYTDISHNKFFYIGFLIFFLLFAIVILKMII